MRTEDTFRRFPGQPPYLTDPKLTREGQIDFQTHGRDFALYNEWRRAWLDPLETKLANFVGGFNPRQRILSLDFIYIICRELCAFECVARYELHVSGDQLAHLNKTINSTLCYLAVFWTKFYKGVEQCPPAPVEESPYYYPKLDNELRARVHDWFRRHELDFEVMRGLLSGEKDRRAYGVDTRNAAEYTGARYWHIFLAGLAQNLASERWYWPSRDALWRERFNKFSRCFYNTDTIGEPWMIRDPITYGGARAVIDQIGYLGGSDRERLWYMVQNITDIMEHIFSQLKMADSHAEQAICAFVELHKYPSNAPSLEEVLS
ncbi:hypothetical protein HDZ31DRAFT_72598 [Schizophyllum fasciatum]